MWADPAPGGGPPNNWLDATGASAWAWHEPTGQYYLHNFLDSQPDLNWWEPAVHEEFAGILRFWLDRGVAGFRIDVAHGLYKDAKLRDNPPEPRAGPHGRTSSATSPSTTRTGRRRTTSTGTGGEIADSYPPPRLLLGETWVADLAPAGQLLRSATTNCSWRSTSRSCSPPSPRRTCPAVVSRDAGQAPGRGMPGVDGLQSRRWPVPDPLVRRRRAEDPARPAACWPPCRGPRCSTTATRSG